MNISTDTRKNSRRMVDSGVEWIGEIPEGWSVKTPKGLIKIRNGYPFSADQFSMSADDGVRLIRIRDLGSDESQIFTSEGCPQSAIVENGEILVGMDGDFTAHVWTRGKAKLNQRVCAIGETGEFDRRYFFHSINEYLKRLNEETNSTTVKHLSHKDILNAKLPYPPHPEQQAIASYLDHHTSLIDRERELISAKIEALREQRKALIFECVTGKRRIVEAQHLSDVDDWSDIVRAGNLAAVPVARKDVPFVKEGRLVDSGVEWIGEIPEGWEIRRFEKFLRKVKRQNGGTLPPGALSYGKVVEKTDEKLPDSTRSTYQDVLCGDLVLNPINLNYDLKSLRTGLSEKNVCVSPAYIVMQNLDGDVSYIKHALHVFDLFRMKDIGAGVRQTVTFHDIQKEEIAWPPLPEQRTIASFLDHYASLVDQEITLLTQKDNLLSEKRKALIFEAVTGKLDITG